VGGTVRPSAFMASRWTHGERVAVYQRVVLRRWEYPVNAHGAASDA
jgi:hypothetical protein